ncbi:MAG TPA: HD domain-containing protein [Candidatus Saccharimonadales bacterium]|nr:HD domain-containing protein [Candidatus Saccharimonadales bacterium]
MHFRQFETPESIHDELIDVIATFPVHNTVKTEVLGAAEDWRVAEGMRQLINHDPDTFKHVIQVGMLAAHLAEHDQLSDEHKKLLTMSSIMHDIGKTGIDLEIVNPVAGDAAKVAREAASSDRRFTAIKLHPQIGYLMAVNLFRDEAVDKYRRLVPELVLTHHCHNESRAQYPDEAGFEALEAEGVLDLVDLEDPELQWLGQYLAVADVYEAITAYRKYAQGDGFEDPSKVLSSLLEAHPTMEDQINELMEVHLRRFPPDGWMSTINLVALSSQSEF